MKNFGGEIELNDSDEENLNTENADIFDLDDLAEQDIDPRILHRL